MRRLRGRGRTRRMTAFIRCSERGGAVLIPFTDFEHFPFSLLPLLVCLSYLRPSAPPPFLPLIVCTLFTHPALPSSPHSSSFFLPSSHHYLVSFSLPLSPSFSPFLPSVSASVLSALSLIRLMPSTAFSTSFRATSRAGKRS